MDLSPASKEKANTLFHMVICEPPGCAVSEDLLRVCESVKCELKTSICCHSPFGHILVFVSLFSVS